MHDLRWQHRLDEFARDYFVAAFRPELPAEERLRAAEAAAASLRRLAEGGSGASRYLAEQITGADTQRRNAAARALSVVGAPADIEVLVANYLEPKRQWLSPSHLIRAARRAPLDPELRRVIPEAPLRLQGAWVRALLADEHPEGRALLTRLCAGPDPVLAGAAVEAVAEWANPDLLWAILMRVDGVDEPGEAMVAAAVEAALQLSLSGEERATDWLEERTMDVDPMVGARAHVALAILGWPACLAELAEVIEEERGAALGFALEAAEILGAAALMPSLCRLVRDTADQAGSGLDDNPADHAIRVLEHLTGRFVPASLCSFDRFGNLDAATRQRAALVHGSAASAMDPATRYRGGRPLSVQDWVGDLLSPAPRRVHVAALQLNRRLPTAPPLRPRGDLLGNLEAVRFWRASMNADSTGGQSGVDFEAPAPLLQY